MTLVEVVTIAAIFCGPIVAVRLTRYLDDKKEARNRRLHIYRVLMATRAANLSGAHVEALNSIDTEFGKRRRDTDVRSAWKAYLDLLSDQSMPRDQWGVRRVDLLVDLLWVMGKNVGYSYDKTHIKNTIYWPTAHAEIETDQNIIRRGLRDLFEGRRPLPMYVTNLPQQPAAGQAPAIPPQTE